LNVSRSSAEAVPKMGIGGTLLVFGWGGGFLWAATRLAIPALVAGGSEPVVAWFLAGGLLVFVPMLVASAVLLRGEALGSRGVTWRQRLRLDPPTAGDWLWSLAGLAGVGVWTLATLVALRSLAGDVPLHPPFLNMEPLGPGRYWIFAAWLPLWLVNIFGEEILWRGVVLPRQEAAFGRWAWLANAAGWALFHIPFGVTILVLLWPALLIVPYVAQRRKNTWTGIVIHAGLNGPGFVAVALGWV
jgi:membrane protease YdiL (CAAX protease family)